MFTPSASNRCFSILHRQFNSAAANFTIFGSSLKTPLVVPLYFYNRILSPELLEKELDVAKTLRPAIASLVFHQVTPSDIGKFFQKTFESLEENKITHLDFNCNFFGYNSEKTVGAIQAALEQVNPKQVQVVRILNNRWSNSQVEKVTDAFLKTNIKTIDLSGNSAQDLWLEAFEKKINEKCIQKWKQSPKIFFITFPHLIFKVEVKPRQVYETGC